MHVLQTLHAPLKRTVNNPESLNMRIASLNRLKKNYFLESFHLSIPITTSLRFTIIHSHPPLRKVLRLCKYWMSLIETEKCGDWLQCSLFERTNVWLPYYQFVRQCALLQAHNRWNTNFSIVNTNKSKCALCVESLHLTHCNPLHLDSIVWCACELYDSVRVNVELLRLALLFQSFSFQLALYLY